MAENSPIPPEKLHALGLITLEWNSAEVFLFILFTVVSRLGGGVAWIMVRELGDVTLSTRIEGFLDHGQRKRMRNSYTERSHKAEVWFRARGCSGYLPAAERELHAASGVLTFGLVVIAFR